VHALAGRKTRGRTGGTSERRAHERFFNIRRGELVRQRLARAQRVARRDLVGVNKLARKKELLQPVGPFLVVGHGE